MKHALWAGLVLLVSLVWTPLEAQVNQTDAKGRKQGAWEKRFPDGQLRYTGQFVDDRPVGTFLYYHPDGKKKAEHRYRQTPNRCSSVQFDDQGRLMAEGVYQGELKDSVWTMYSFEGKLISKETYRLGVLHGTQTTFHTNGRVAEEGSCENGKKKGLWTRTTEEGQKLSAVNYLDDLPEGEAVYWDGQGQKVASGSYVRGLESDWWVFYEEGRPKERVRYRAGKELERSSI